MRVFDQEAECVGWIFAFKICNLCELSRQSGIKLQRDSGALAFGHFRVPSHAKFRPVETLFPATRAGGGFRAGSFIEVFHARQVIAFQGQILADLSLDLADLTGAQLAETFNGALQIRLGLEGQPRAIVFHEKEGRRHAHAVWSRIDSETMTARPLPWFKTRLMDISRELYLHHEWDMPHGFIDQALRNPLNFSREEWQQAKRREVDPRLLKSMFRACWHATDNAATLKRALEEKGFFLARGDRRGVVAVDYRGEVYALGRYSGVKEKDVRGRFPKLEALPSVDAAYGKISPSIEFCRTQMVQRQRHERAELGEAQKERWKAEERARAANLPRGFSGIWQRITGKYQKIKLQNEVETLKSWQRDRAEKDAMIARQQHERQDFRAAVQSASVMNRRI